MTVNNIDTTKTLEAINKLFDAVKDGAQSIKETYERLTPEQKYALGVAALYLGSIVTILSIRLQRKQSEVSMLFSMLENLGKKAA